MFGKVALFDGKEEAGWGPFLESLRREGIHGIFLMVGEATPFSFDHIRPLFAEAGIPVFGGIFPGVIFGESWHKQGVVGCAIDCPISLQIVKDLGKFQAAPGKASGAGFAGSVLVIVDGLALNISPFLEALFETYPGRANFIGGGAGSVSLIQKPVLFTSEECFSNGALVVGIEGFVGVGVSHGWEAMYGPLVANRTAGNVIIDLNWQPAFRYYKQIIEREAGEVVEPGNFFDMAKGYPLGMVRMDGSMVVRDPIKVDGDGNLLLVGEVPENSVLMVLKGNPGSLIHAAGQAAREAVAVFERRGGNTAAGALVIDCISRVLYLGDLMAEEIGAIRNNIAPTLPLFGFFSLGEVASPGDRYLEFLNKTTVVGVGR